MTDSAENPFEACAHCGEPFRLGVKYPVITRRVNGEMEFFSFCDVECRDAWETTSDEADVDRSPGSADE